jgi:regulator of protease activity HflC (stomatin/prohibitin superfamily)
MKSLNTIISIILGIVFLLVSGIKVIDPGDVGVRSTLGNIHPDTLKAGIHFTIPLLDNVAIFSTRTIDVPEIFESITKDGQKMRVTATALFSLNPLKAANIYAQIGSTSLDLQNKVIQPALLGAVNQVISASSMFDVIESQNTISTKVEQKIKNTLDTNSYVLFDSFTISRFSLDPEVQTSIEQKQIAEQQLQRKGIEVDIATKEAERLKILSKSITPKTLLLEAISKWDGHGIPPTLGGNTNLLIQSR